MNKRLVNTNANLISTIAKVTSVSPPVKLNNPLLAIGSG